MYADRIDLYCRWLYQTARADGKPRVLAVGRNLDFAPISLFIERLKQVIMVKTTHCLKNILFQDFQMATDPATFFIQINLPKAFLPLEHIILDNGNMKERLEIKMDEAKVQEEVVLQISRCPLASTKKWIEENENEILSWDISEYNEKTIHLTQELKVVQI
jgi:hypothetical protein